MGHTHNTLCVTEQSTSIEGIADVTRLQVKKGEKGTRKKRDSLVYNILGWSEDTQAYCTLSSFFVKCCMSPTWSLSS